MEPNTTQPADAPPPAVDTHDTPTLADELKAPTVSRAYQCQCGRPVFLSNSECLACHTPLGYVIERLGVVPLQPAAEPDTWNVFGDDGGKAYHRCANFVTAAGCNWMMPAPREGDDDPSFGTAGLAQGYCLSCSTTRTIPDLSVEGNGELWRKLERAKRRLISQLLALGLPVVTRFTDPVHGMSFDFLSNVPGALHVLTGHEQGVITLNAEEAEDSVRERIRAEMREPYRTLVGHFRHEIGHYYWDMLILPTPWIEDFRQLFGDERADYMSALKSHYESGPPADWAQRFVTSYASSHPWEDWAETWAHYLHMADTADTALSFGVDVAKVELVSDLFAPEDLWQPEHPEATQFLDFLNGWVRLTNMLNELSRSMGQPDYYPFVLPRVAVGKLQFIHQVIAQQRERGGVWPEAAMAAPAESPSAAAPPADAPPAEARPEDVAAADAAPAEAAPKALSPAPQAQAQQQPQPQP
jgi:hypothetical protein